MTNTSHYSFQNNSHASYFSLDGLFLSSSFLSYHRRTYYKRSCPCSTVCKKYMTSSDPIYLETKVIFLSTIFLMTTLHATQKTKIQGEHYFTSWPIIGIEADIKAIKHQGKLVLDVTIISTDEKGRKCIPFTIIVMRPNSG